jgi:hypothetical protein
MSNVDTSAEAVERLAKLIAMHGDDADATTLRALLVEHADVTRLRRSWLAVIQAENSCPATGGGCLSKRCGCLEEMEMLMREDDARAPEPKEQGA